MDFARSTRTSEESAANVACVLFLPFVELVLAMFLGLAGNPVIAMLILPGALATLAYPISTALGTSRAYAAAQSVKTFFVCLLVGGCSMIALAITSFYSTF